MRGTWAAATMATAVIVLAGCSGEPAPDGAPSGTGPHDTPKARAEVACPDALVEAEGDKESGGWTPADRDVDLEPFDAAWLCEYSWANATPDTGGESSPWTLQGDPAPIVDADLAALSDALGALELWTDRADEIVCTLDLGPTWMLILADGESLTGVTFEEFGCGFARLTDDPYSTAPGQSRTLPAGSYLGGDVLREIQRLAGVTPRR
ncbi:hypothetical protein [Demequina zhanjiangensis]|uniref:Uncharacterized protein n=1 Tax=Demequina zhanjiangensis TaxID=3051659 RepID=A0ABT8G3I0_9MICO|nr:hypothetical protein [Demequina sp. SYSU T00b26]MDN4473695.1 hypothetical protein [Demequina sp. SYSU T00b26]